ncbi:MAG: ASCH domain-containing protein [Acetobacteraceae bacterium]
MVAYSFKRDFAAPILAGIKRQTIRADRRRHARPGEVLQLYTGMRTKHAA